MELSNSLLLNESALNQLSKPKRAVFIHEWLRYLDQILPVAEKSDIKDCQKNLLSQMSSLINSGLGPPSRHLMARCLATLFSVGDAFYLYEAVNVCNDILKVKDDSPNYLPSKLTAICCIGAMYKSLGRMVGRSFEETTQILIRSLKNAESQSRAEIMNTLACLVSGLESGGSSVHKEIYKVAKSMLLDRQMAVRCAASKCIQALVLEAQFVWTHELETLCSTCFKAFDGCTHAVRRSIAKLLGLVLATAHNPPSNAKRLAAGVHHGVGMQPPSVKPISIEDVWAILSSGFLRGGMGFLKTSTNFHSGVSKEVRAGTAMAYVEFFTCLGSSWLEKSLAKCVRHFFDLVTSGCQGSAGHGEAVFIRQCAVFALSNPLSKLFSEKMQMIACKEMGQIIAEHMNSFDSMSEADSERSTFWDLNGTHHAVECLLRVLSVLVMRIGSVAAPLFVEASGILEPIFSVLLHPSELCRIAAAWCLRCISITVPSLMTPLLERCLLRLEHNKNSANAISGYSCATAALTAAVCHCPLGIPNSKCKASRLVQLALVMLRTAAQDSKLAMVKTESGWLLLSAAVTLGPLMVKSQLARLLSALKSVFPRTKKEAEQELSRGDFYTWQVTLTSRAGSMVLIRNLLVHCKSLIDEEAMQKMLIPIEAAIHELDLMGSILKLHGQQLRKYCSMFKWRLFEALVHLNPSYYLSYFTILLREVVSEFTVVEGSNVNCTSLLHDFCCNEEAILFDLSFLLCDYRQIEELIHPIAQKPAAVAGSELNVFELCLQTDKIAFMQPTLPLSTALVDASVMLFGHVFPYVQSKHRVQMMEHFADCIKQLKGAKQATVQGNVVLALIWSLKVSLLLIFGNLADGKLSLEKSGNLLDTVLNLVTSLLPCPSVVLRYAAAEAFGRLAQVAPEPQFIAEMVQVSYDKLKLCRDANTRTGHSLALGCLHRYVGGLASGHQLDVSVSVLLALAQDTSSQLVQVWALYSLRLIADSGGPMYRSFVEPTLNVCLNLLLSSSSFTANDVGQCVSRLVAALITTVGPELQNNVGSVVRIRSNFLVISAIMSAHPDPFVQAQSIGCYQQLYLFAPLHVDLSLLVRRLCSLFTSCHLILRRAAFCCLRQLVQREARQVHQHVQALIPEGLNAAKVRIKGSASATDIASYLSAPSIQDSVLPETGIEGALFAALDDEDDPSAVSDLKEILLNLVQSLGSENLAHWLELCKDVVASADCNQSKEVPVAQDEQQEDDAWHVAESSREQERSSRWPSRVFAVQLVQKLITACEGERAHFDLALAKELQMNGRKSDYLVLHLSDLVRMSFMAATSNCTELRLAGLSCLKNVISKFADVPEPEFSGHFILEQFQAQVSAALRPAFSIDTPGNITALACEVCSSWISSGVAKDVNNLRRVHQLLVAPLSKLKTESISVHLYNESCTALEKLSVLKAWAEVYIVAMNQELGRTDRGASLCSTGQPDVCYSDVLLQLVEPELNMLVEYWLAVLRDYALLSLPAEFHSQLPAEGICFTLETADLVRPYYKSVWATVLLAASIWLSGNNFELSTVEPADEGTRLNVLKDYTKTEWFHILLGISIEALCSPKNFDPLHIRFCLASIKVMLANEWAQLQLLAGAKLAVDLLNVMHRLVLTRENVQLQSLCADIVVLVLDAAGRCCDSMQSGAKSDFLPTESGGKLYCGMEGGDDGLFHVNNSIVYAALEVILCLLVRQVPEINPVIVRSKTFLAQRRSATVTLSNESRQLLTTAVRCLVKLSSMCSDEVSTERFVVLLSGRLTLLPIQLYLLTNTVRETSNLHNEPLVHGGGPGSSTGGDFCPKQPAAAALQSIRCLLKKPVLLQDGATSEPDPRWVRIMQCALWSLLLTDKEESTENDRSTLILSVAIFMLNSPKPVLNHCQIRDRICGLLRSCLAEDCNFNVQVTCLQTLASTFACKDRSVSSEFIQALAPTVVDKVRSYLVSDNCGEAVTLPGGFQDACSSRVLVESLKALENLIHAAQETQQRLPLLALVVHFLLALTAVEDNVRGSKVRRQLYDFAMERMNSIGSLYTTEFKALLGQLPSLKARVEKALRSAYSTTAAPTAAAAEQRFSLNFKNKQQQQPLDQQSASPSDLLNQQQSSATAANKQTQADQPSITLTMDFSVSVRQDEFLPCLSSELQVAEGIHFQNSDHQVLFESVPAVVGTLAGQDPAQAGQGAVECRADEADIPADDGRQLFGQAGAELRPSGDGLDAGEVFEKFVPRRPTARVGQKRDQLVENVILAEAVAPDRDAGPAVRLLQILAHLFQVGFVERKYRRVNVGQFQPFANFQIELFEIFVNFAFVLLSADIFRVKFQI
ncbi:HEAT repeat-containing protein 5B [Trichinella spiralis]|uniref:HEAT repeat-containing protein 5B n=1 Tax=Trichinella spiralis TaxID=6334 RepID=A0A0V1BEU9_TRISP|nr:HEAT repeat-containing protein 5B [Trichinella spiralis]